jgi:hypothetical protein
MDFKTTFHPLSSLVSFFVLFTNIIMSQVEKDTSTLHIDYKNKAIIYSDLGYSSAPFTIQFNTQKEDVKLAYKNNIQPFIGVGFIYKFISLHYTHLLPIHVKSIDKYGNNKYFNLNFDYTYKNIYSDIGYSQYQGFGIKNTEYLISGKNQIYNELKSKSFYLNSWYFGNKDFKITSLKGIKSVVDKELFSWYLKGTFNVFNLKNPEAILPNDFTSTNTTINSSYVVQGIDIGIVPGLAYVKRTNDWQYGTLAGFGGVLQEKGYKSEQANRYFIGLAPRYDLKIMIGYTQHDLFTMLHFEIDNKTIRLNQFKYNQSYYTIRIIGGYRF